MIQYSDDRTQRNDDLIKGLASAARNRRLELYEWVQREITQLLSWAQVHEPKAEGIIRDQLQQAIIELRKINHRELPEAVSETDDRIRDTANGGFEDLYDACTQLAEACRPLERILRDVEQLGGSLIEHFD